jgi:hypothetical protein
MAQNPSLELIISIVFGVLQLVLGLISLWQQRHRNRASTQVSSIYLGQSVRSLTLPRPSNLSPCLLTTIAAGRYVSVQIGVKL